MVQRKGRGEVGRWEVGQALPLGGVSQLDPTKVDPAIRVDLTKTLPVMESRKSMRRVHGTYFPTRPVLTWFLFWILLATSFLQSIQWQAESVLIQFSVHFGANRAGNGIAAFTYIIVLIFIFLLVSAQVRFHMFWSLGVTVVFVVLQAALLIHRRGGSWKLQSSLLGGYLAVQLAGLACQAFAWRAFPRLQRRLWYLNKLELHGTIPLKRTASPSTTQVPRLTGTQASCSFKYVGPLSRFLPHFIRRHRTYHLSYMGEVDAHGRPHGYGEWMDTYCYGEELRGIWEGGVPVGPFKARESGSGSAFVNLRIGYIQNRRDKPDQARSTTPTALSYGVVAVECGTAGLFFRDYPQATPITGPLPVASVSNPKLGPDPETGPPNPDDDVAIAIQNILDNMPIAEQLRPKATLPTSLPAQHMALCNRANPLQAEPASSYLASPAQHPGRNPPSGLQPKGGNPTGGVPESADGDAEPTLRSAEATPLSEEATPGSGEATLRVTEVARTWEHRGPPATRVDASLQACDVKHRHGRGDAGRADGGASAHLATTPVAGHGASGRSDDGPDRAHGRRDETAFLPRADDMASRQATTTVSHVPSNASYSVGEGGAFSAHSGGSGGVSKQGLSNVFMPSGPDAADKAVCFRQGQSDKFTPPGADLALPNQAMSLKCAAAAGGPLTLPKGVLPSPSAALVFIHGCNCSLGDGCKSMGQFMALANLPPCVRPFVFSWPTGVLINYLQAKVNGAEAAVTAEAFAGLVRGLGEVGFQELHIMTHSMGVRVLMAAIPQLEALYGVGASSTEKSVGKATPGVRLATVSLLNPDFELAEFTNGAGQRLRALCPLITLYGDRQDLALWSAAIFNGIHTVWKGMKQAGEEQPKCCAKARGFALERSVGRHVYSVVDPQGHPLDIDVVDTTFLDANVQDARHMSFNLNSSLVDDLREVVTFQRRAWERTSGLDARGANVYSFLVAPTYIKNK